MYLNLQAPNYSSIPNVCSSSLLLSVGHCNQINLAQSDPIKKPLLYSKQWLFEGNLFQILQEYLFPIKNLLH
jgi:hypothetical protein